MNNPKGAGFNGKSKNRNKKIDKVDRKVIYTKKMSRRQFNTRVIAREGMGRFEGQTVEISAELKFVNSKDPHAPALLEHVYIENEYSDHIWIHFSKEDRKKLQYCYKGCRILFTGTVIQYTKRSDRQIGIKYGITDAKLKGR